MDLYRSGQKLQRTNSITLEQKEKEAKEKILNIFSMRSKIKKWKNNTDNLNSKGWIFIISITRRSFIDIYPV